MGRHNVKKNMGKPYQKLQFATFYDAVEFIDFLTTIYYALSILHINI